MPKVIASSTFGTQSSTAQRGHISVAKTSFQKPPFSLFQGEIITPPLPPFLAIRHFQGRGEGVYIMRPHAAGILYAPPLLCRPFYSPPPPPALCTPPTPRRVFSSCFGSSPSQGAAGRGTLRCSCRGGAMEAMVRPNGPNLTYSRPDNYYIT